MRNENYLKFGIAAVILILGVTISCSRNFAVPVTPNLTTNTPTTTATNTATTLGANTFTATNTATVTPTSTATNTATTTATNTATTLGANTFTATNTATVTATNTATSTATATATNTPLATVYPLIDDFEGTGAGGGDSTTGVYNATDQNATLRNGAVFTYAESPVAVSTITLALSATAEQGSNSLETSGDVSGSANSNFAGWGFNFTTSGGTATAYDATVSGRYIGISFYVQAKSMAVSNCTGVQAIKAILQDSVNSISVAVPVTQGGWTPVTLFFNQFVTSTGTALNPAQLLQAQFQILDNGFMGANYNFDILWDNFQLVPVGAPGAPAVAATPLPANIVDMFSNGTNQNQYGGSANAGYWFNYSGGTATATCPYVFSSGPVFDSVPANALPGAVPVIPGIPSFCQEFSGTLTGYGAIGFNWNGASSTSTVNLSGYNQLVFWTESKNPPSTTSINFVDTEHNGCNNLNNISFTPTASWQAVTITFNSSCGACTPAYGLAAADEAGGGCTSGGSGVTGLDPTAIIQTVFKPPVGSAFDLQIADMYLQ